jgi:hypothetical protein
LHKTIEIMMLSPHFVPTHLHLSRLELTPAASQDLQTDLASVRTGCRPVDAVPEQYLLLLTCRDETNLVERLPSMVLLS